MRGHCQHSSTAKTCAIFAYLLLECSEYHELLNHEASQSSYGACLRAAGDEAEFLYSSFADVKMLIQQLLTGTKHYQNGIIIYLPERQDHCGSGGMLFTLTRTQLAPPHGYRQPSVSDSIWSSPGTYGRIYDTIKDFSPSCMPQTHVRSLPSTTNNP
jgi:hypothetical protein